MPDNKAKLQNWEEAARKHEQAMANVFSQQVCLLNSLCLSYVQTEHQALKYSLDCPGVLSCHVASLCAESKWLSIPHYMHGQLKWSTPQRNMLSIDSEPHQPHWVWSWMDWWMAVHAWENHNLDCLKAGCLPCAKSLAVRTKHVDKHGWCGPQGWPETFNNEMWSEASFGILTNAQWEGWTHSSVPSTSTKASCPHNCWFPPAYSWKAPSAEQWLTTLVQDAALMPPWSVDSSFFISCKWEHCDITTIYRPSILLACPNPFRSARQSLSWSLCTERCDNKWCDIS